jgi:hypothetical protein
MINVELYLCTTYLPYLPTYIYKGIKLLMTCNSPVLKSEHCLDWFPLYCKVVPIEF